MESAVIVPVLQADGLLRPWRPRWQPAAPVGIPAHVTLAYPFLPADELGTAALSGLSAVFGAQPPFSVSLGGVGRRPGIVYLEVDPAEQLVALAAQVHAAFPASRSEWGGPERPLVPHVTALRSDDDEALDAAASALAVRLPLACRLAEVWLVQATGDTRAWLVGEGTGERWTLRMRFGLGLSRY